MELVDSSPGSVVDGRRRPPSRTLVALLALAFVCIGGPFGLAGRASEAAPVQRLVYVANLRSDTVSVYDPASNAVVATIPGWVVSVRDCGLARR